MTPDSFNELVSVLARKLFGHAFRILGNRVEAEDAVQEVFLKLWNLGDKLDGYDSAEALAVTMTKNYCIDQLRKRGNNENKVQSDQIYSLATDPDPYESIVRKETFDILESIIKRLPENYRIIIRLREIEGLSYVEIAEKTDMNINALRVSLSRARKMIRDEYIKYRNEN